MAGRTLTLTAKLLADSKAFTAGMDGAASTAQKFQAKLNKLTVPAAAIVGGLAVVGKKFVDLAAEAEQNFGGSEAVFGQYADVIKKKGADAYKTLGLSQSDYLSTANKMGSLFQGSGIDQQKSLTMTSDAMQRAADVASVMGVDTASAMEAVTGAAKGNFTMMDNLGVAMNATSIEAYAASKGMTDFKYATASTAEKSEVAMKMFLEKTSQYAGNFTKELGTMSGAQDMLKAQFENFGVKIGSALLPVLTEMTQHLSGIVDWASENATVLLILAGVLGGLAAGVLVVNGAMKAWAAAQVVAKVATTAWTAAQWLFNAAMTANPIGLVILAVVALVAAVVLAYNNIGWFKDGVDAALKWISQAWTNTTKWISEAWTNTVNFLQAAVTNVQNFFGTVFGAIGAFVGTVVNNIKGFFTTGFNAVRLVVQIHINAVKAIISSIIAVASSVGANVRSFFTNAFNAVANVVHGVINGITSTISRIVSTISYVTGNITNLFYGAFSYVSQTVSTVINGVVNGFNSVTNAVQNAYNWVRNLFSGFSVPGWLSKVMSFMGKGATGFSVEGGFDMTGLDASMGATGSILSLAGASRGKSSGPSVTEINYNIAVNGALDPIAVARQIKQIINADDIRNGKSSAGGSRW